MSGSREYRERLIDEVKRYPVLYDTRHEHHRDIDARDRCWAEISRRLGANCEVLKREWKILRDSLRQALKKSRKGATTKAGLPCKKWRFQSRMSFVLPHMMVRRGEGAAPKGDIKVDEAEMQSEVEQELEVWEPSGADEDSLDLFFASVCQSTRRLPARFRNQVKRQVLDVLMRAEEEHEKETAPSQVAKLDPSAHYNT